MNTYRLIWGPTAAVVARVVARDSTAARRKAPQPYRKFLGEVRAEKEPDVELKPIGDKEARAAFMQAYTEFTYIHPFMRKTRVWEEQNTLVLFEVSDWDNRICLDCICVSPAGHRKWGIGTAALKWLLRLADKHGVSVHGTIEPIGLKEDRMDAVQLARWYAKHGFVLSSGRQITYLPQLMRTET